MEPVGQFTFGDNFIEADPTGAFNLSFPGAGFFGRTVSFDLGEITSLQSIIQCIDDGKSTPLEQNPETFWRTNGSKVIEVFVGKDARDKLSQVVIREGGTNIVSFPLSDATMLLRHLQVLIKNAPYGRFVSLLETRQREEKATPTPIGTERFPLRNTDSKAPLRVEKEFGHEIKKRVTVQTSVSVGVDYFVKLCLEKALGLTEEYRIAQKIKVIMEALPGEHKEYVISWRERITLAEATFMVHGAREFVQFQIHSGLEADVRHELVTTPTEPV